jgi:hypothetical protein
VLADIWVSEFQPRKVAPLMTDFNGFGAKTRKFLRDLGRHNDKAWL